MEQFYFEPNTWAFKASEDLHCVTLLAEEVAGTSKHAARLCHQVIEKSLKQVIQADGQLDEELSGEHSILTLAEYAGYDVLKEQRPNWEVLDHVYDDAIPSDSAKRRGDPDIDWYRVIELIPVAKGVYLWMAVLCGGNSEGA